MAHGRAPVKILVKNLVCCFLTTRQKTVSLPCITLYTKKSRCQVVFVQQCIFAKNETLPVAWFCEPCIILYMDNAQRDGKMATYKVVQHGCGPDSGRIENEITITASSKKDMLVQVAAWMESIGLDPSDDNDWYYISIRLK